MDTVHVTSPNNAQVAYKVNPANAKTKNVIRKLGKVNDALMTMWYTLIMAKMKKMARKTRNRNNML